MRNGDSIRISQDGLELKPKAVEPLSIFDNSSCWGVWVAGRPARDSTDSRKPKNLRRHLPHLVVSPIHPDLWPFSAHVEMRLKDEPGALANVSRLLSEGGANIIFADCAASGYRQATLSSVIEFESLRKHLLGDLQKKSPLTMSDYFRSSSNKGLGSLLTPKENKDRNIAFANIGQGINAEIFRFWSTIRLAEDKLYHDAREKYEDTLGRQRTKNKDAQESLDFPGEFFFPSRVVQEGCEPWMLKSTTKELDEILKLSTEYANQDDNFSIPEIYRAVSTTKKRTWNSKLKQVDQDQLTTEAEFFQQLSRHAEQGKAKDDATKWARGLIRRFLRRHWIEPIRIQALFTLAYYRMWAHPKYPLVRFRYDASRGLLIPANREIIREVLSAAKGRTTTSGLAIAAFHRYDRFVRIEFVDDHERTTSLFRIRMNYEIDSTPAVARKNKSESSTTDDSSPTDEKGNENSAIVELRLPAGSPRGLLSVLSDAIRKTNINLLMLSNQLTNYEPLSQVESGAIDLIGQGSPNVAPQIVEDCIKSLVKNTENKIPANRNGIAKSTPQNNSIGNSLSCRVKISTTPFPDRSLFFSSVFEAARFEEYSEVLAEEAAASGFMLRQVQQYTDPATAKVNEAIRESQAMIQLITLRDADRLALDHNRDYVPNFWWLMYEYGFARSQEISLVRMIDSDMPYHIRKTWDRIDRDTPFISYQGSCSREHFRKKVRSAINCVRKDETSGRK